MVAFSGYFLVELTVSNLQVTWDVLTPRSRLRPGVVALPMRSRTPAEVALLSNLVTLTPGTLTLAVEGEGPEGVPVMYVHGMYAADQDAFRAELADLEHRMLHAVRLEGDR